MLGKLCSLKIQPMSRFQVNGMREKCEEMNNYSESTFFQKVFWGVESISQNEYRTSTKHISDNPFVFHSLNTGVSVTFRHD